MSRRSFIQQSAMAAASVAVGGVSSAQPLSRRFTMNLVTFMIGVTVKSQAEANALAVRHGFESVEARGQDFLAMTADELARLRDQLQRDRLAWGAGFLPNDARADAARHETATTPTSTPACSSTAARAGRSTAAARPVRTGTQNGTRSMRQLSCPIRGSRSARGFREKPAITPRTRRIGAE